MTSGRRVNFKNGETFDLANSQSQGVEIGFVINMLQLDFLSVGSCQKFVYNFNFVHNICSIFLRARLSRQIGSGGQSTSGIAHMGSMMSSRMG